MKRRPCQWRPLESRLPAKDFMPKEESYRYNDANQKGGAVAGWSKALQLREKIKENQKIPGLPPPAWATFCDKKCK